MNEKCKQKRPFKTPENKNYICFSTFQQDKIRKIRRNIRSFFAIPLDNLTFADPKI